MQDPAGGEVSGIHFDPEPRRLQGTNRGTRQGELVHTVTGDGARRRACDCRVIERISCPWFETAIAIIPVDINERAVNVLLIVNTYFSIEIPIEPDLALQRGKSGRCEDLNLGTARLIGQRLLWQWAGRAIRIGQRVVNRSAVLGGHP